jgi:hypothetical protein
MQERKLRGLANIENFSSVTDWNIAKSFREEIEKEFHHLCIWLFRQFMLELVNLLHVDLRCLEILQIVEQSFQLY